MSQSKSYTSGEVAKFCGVTLRTVIRWIERGSLKAYKLPGRGNNRITKDEVLRFMNEFEMPIPHELTQVSVTKVGHQVGSEVQDNSNRILICDDEKAYADAIRRTLRRAGYETQSALSGFEAGAELVRFNPVLITLDLSMPGMSGFEVISHIRDREQFKELKILVVSALTDEQLQKAILMGADKTISKPFDNETLTTAVQELLS